MMTFRAVILASAALVSATSASAGVVDYLNYPASAVFGPDGTATIPAFDKSLGTLGYVNVRFSGTYNTMFTLTNNSDSFFGGGGPLTVNFELLLNGKQVATASGFSGFGGSLTPGSSIGGGVSFGANGGVELYDVDDFLGAAPVFSFRLVSANLPTWAPAGIVGRYGDVSTMPGNVSLNYFYAAGAASGAVPEPATWATMMLGFGMLGMAARRRRKAAATA